MIEIKITPSGIKKAIDDLLNENELLQDKVYKQEDKIEELRALYFSEREVKEDYKSKVNKAIEYLEKADDNENSYGDYEIHYEVKKELLDILKEKEEER